MKITPSQKTAISALVDRFREAMPVVHPDFTCCDKGKKTLLMTREQLEDYAYRTLQVALENL